jgi:hypothetical protein
VCSEAMKNAGWFRRLLVSRTGGTVREIGNARGGGSPRLVCQLKFCTPTKGRYRHAQKGRRNCYGCWSKKQALRALEFLSLAQERLVRIASGKSKDVQDDLLHAHDYAEVVISVADENLPAEDR